MSNVPYLRVPSRDSLAEGGPLCVGLAGSAITHNTTQRHTALIVKSEGGDWQRLHSTLNGVVLREACDSQYCWVEVLGIDPVIRDNLIDWVLELWKNHSNPGVPYGFDVFTEDSLKDDRTYNGQGDAAGLTCATFVLAVFARYGIKLLDPSTWDKRPDDAIWQWQIAERFQHILGDARKNALQSIAGKVARFRPEEVAGCAGVDLTRPIQFAVGEHLGGLVLAQMEEEQLL